MSPPSQQSLDAAAFLKNYVMAQQQHQQQQPPPPQGSVASAPPTMPAAPAQAPQAQAPHAAAVSLQQLIMAAQQQRPGSTPLPQLDANTARLVTDALNMAKQQAQQQHQAGAPPAAAPVAPPPQPYQQNMATYGSVDSTSPPAVLPPQPQQHHQHQQTLLASAQLLGSLNPSIAAALMTTALQQSAGVTNLPFSPSQTTLNSKQAPENSRSSSSTLGSGSNNLAAGGTTRASTTFPPPTLSAAASLSGQAAPPLSILSAPAGGPPPAVASLHHHHHPQQQHRPPPTNHPITKMQRWSLEQLESHAKELQDGGYQLPQAVAILLADARRKEEKRQAKRIANRKSACTSRARKKAKIDQLMNENAQLRRLELILSYLPDPIIVVSPTGVITFCNTQVERVFKHKVNDLVGANIEDVMIPKSRGVIKKLIRDMLVAEQELSETSDSNAAIAKKKSKSGEGSGSSGDRNIISENTSESAFPLLEVKLNSTDVDAAEDVSDSDENRRLASLAHKDSSFNNNEGDDTTPNSSEKEMRNALAKNVEACKINKYKAKTEQVRFAHKDDVMGASVTANNADAKLSSLMHEPSSLKNVMSSKLTSDKQEEQSSSTLDSSLSKTSSEKAQAKEGNSSEDSGYRESGESPEDSNSSSSSGGSADSKNEKRKRARPMAPSRNVCLIRSDMSSIWCELTSSIRTSIALPEDTERGSVSKEGSVEQPEEPEQLEKEILLCFRPIQEGEKVSSDLRFNHVQVKHGISESSGDAGTSSTHPASTETQLDVPKNKPLKKRIFEDQQSAELANKKSRVASDETSAVETMMELARKSLQ
mmetsp:Transcript_21291/g.32866  ORF Transcript_21291/g.32866 Transcript_21291/m.32866 type:complete len:819 (-) Transcript_21291:149-2605(-)